MTASGQEPGREQTIVRHGAGFVAAGLIATVADAAILLLATRGAGLDPFTARLIAIACAMVAGFFAHRRLTFAVRDPASVRQFAAYVGVASTAAAINYAIYAAILLARPGTEPVVAMLAPALFAMAISYGGMRFGVFRKPRR